MKHSSYLKASVENSTCVKSARLGSTRAKSSQRKVPRLQSPAKQQGVALMIVLMIVALVAVLATEMGTRLQLQVQRTMNLKTIIRRIGMPWAQKLLLESRLEH